MAQSERFYFWRGYYDAMRKIPTDEQRGRFIMAMCAYAFDGVEPDLSDDLILDIGWSLVADGSRESVRKGVEQSQRGTLGGRPTKGRKTTAKTPAKSGAKTTALSTAESGAESGAESEEKRKEGKRRELSPSLDGERVGASRPAPDGAALAPSNGFTIPPKPEGDA